MQFICVVFTVADVEYVVLGTDERLIKVNVVDKLAVFLILEVCKLAGISYEVVNHLLEDFLEIPHHRASLIGSCHHGWC